MEAMEEVLQVSPLPSKVLQSFINSEPDETETQEVFSSSPDTRQNVNALATLRRGPQSQSLSSFQDPIAEESESTSKKLPSSICTLSRKAPIRRTSTNDQLAKHDRKNQSHLLTKSHSATLDNVLSPYSPTEPLTKLPIKQHLTSDHLQSAADSYFTRTKSINATIGPLTKEVCGKLNISWEKNDPCVSPQDSQQVNATYMKLVIPDHTKDEVYSIPFKENFTLNTIKEELISILKKKYPDKSWKFIFTYLYIYKLEGYHYQLLDDFQYILNSFLYQYYLLKKEFPLIEVREKPLLTEEEAELHDNIHKVTELEINSLISHESGSFNDTQSFNFNGDDEVAWTRSRLQSFAVEVARYRDPMRYSMIMELDHSPITEYFAIRVPPNNMITIFIHFQDIFTLKRQFNLNATADYALSQVYPSLKAIDLVHTQIHNFTLQVTGEESYINGNIKLIQFKAVRRAVFKREDLHLSVVNKPNVKNDRLYGLVWPLVDPFTGSAPSHSYLINLANCGPMNSMVNALSLWDMTFPFKICIKKISNVPPQLCKKDIGVEVEFGLYTSGKLLIAKRKTQSTALKETTVWNETIILEFDMHSIPKAARLMIIVKEDNRSRRKSSLGSNVTQELYWITTSLVDYRSLLKVGTQELYMWPTTRTSGKEFEKLSEGEKFFYNPSSIGPTANNPDCEAVKLTLEFESWAHPIVFPNDIPPTDLLDYAKPRMPSSPKSSSSHQEGINRLIKVINKDKQFTMVLQTYIQKLDWSKPDQVAEAYRFLNELREPLPLAVAFKFLDSTCPDEFIRAFAVERLRELEDDELMGFLLQLVQALKFEANHDSALARFLLERALQNKLIGHLFFWYSRCEAHNPRFTARYGTLLEAYLVGCGKAMLESFLNQVSILRYFKDISKQLDEDGSKNAADSQKLLKELMTKYKFSTRVVVPTHDPRLRLGNLEPERCKIMQSKKMPMWLWMSNIHPSAIQPIPYKLIVKSGDDLRQDMLTLQMLTLFDKIWQEDGLDLCLIPYGCVATGPNSGIIEVVKNARTVADISGIKDSTKLFQWIKDHQRDQFGEEDPDLFQVAINKFVRSCAGYSVATYVLGIGDRHNDNIMVTTAGNLFHIDFGHFLGNVKHFMKIKREWCPFVLTPDFINVMGGEKSSTFVKFKNLCCRAFLSLRKHADLIINLFSIMRYTGIPELTCVEDLEYLSDALMVTKSDPSAEECFVKLINKCIRLGWTVQISWWAHVTKNKKS